MPMLDTHDAFSGERREHWGAAKSATLARQDRQQSTPARAQTLTILGTLPEHPPSLTSNLQTNTRHPSFPHEQGGRREGQKKEAVLSPRVAAFRKSQRFSPENPHPCITNIRTGGQARHPSIPRKSLPRDTQRSHQLRDVYQRRHRNTVVEREADLGHPQNKRHTLIFLTSRVGVTKVRQGFSMPP